MGYFILGASTFEEVVITLKNLTPMLSKGCSENDVRLLMINFFMISTSIHIFICEIWCKFTKFVSSSFESFELRDI